MTRIPTEALPLLSEFAFVFTPSTYRRFVFLLFASILTVGRRTIRNVLRTAEKLAEGHWSSYNRFLSHAEWSILVLACVFNRFLVRTFFREGVIPPVGDDSVLEHRGKKVYGKARRRVSRNSSTGAMSIMGDLQQLFGRDEGR